MPECYGCGCDIPRGHGHRRRVSTGSSVGFTSRGNLSTRNYSGVRTVCEDCAAHLDEQEAAHSRMYATIAVVAILAFCVFCYLILMSQRR